MMMDGMGNATPSLFGRSRRNEKLVVIVLMPSSQITPMISLISKVCFAEAPEDFDKSNFKKCVVKTTEDTAAATTVRDS